jgi:hypothetical protein
VEGAAGNGRIAERQEVNIAASTDSLDRLSLSNEHVGNREIS